MWSFQLMHKKHWQHPFLEKKALNKLGLEGKHLNIVKAIYEKPTANILLNGEKLKIFPVRSVTKTAVPNVTTLIHHSIGNPSLSNHIRKR